MSVQEPSDSGGTILGTCLHVTRQASLTCRACLGTKKKKDLFMGWTNPVVSGFSIENASMAILLTSSKEDARVGVALMDPG